MTRAQAARRKAMFYGLGVAIGLFTIGIGLIWIGG